MTDSVDTAANAQPAPYQPTRQQVLELAGQAGQLLLQSGAEIYRVQQTMSHMLEHFGLTEHNVYVISNGIFATVEEAGPAPLSLVRHVPLGSLNLQRIDAVNTVSRRLCEDRLDFDGARQALLQAAQEPGEPRILSLFAYGVGCFGFCLLFGGRLADGLAAFAVGLLLGLTDHWRLFGQSKFTRFVLKSGFVTVLSVLASWLVRSLGLNQVVIGAIIPLVPGVVFTTAIRELFNGDYLSGLIHLADALLTAVCIALGVVGAMMLASFLGGGV